jgi:hypothetical protein
MQKFWGEFFWENMCKMCSFQQKKFTIYMKSIFNKKKRIIDPYYLVAPPTQPNPTHPSSRLGWRRDGGRDGWMDGRMDGHDQRRDSITLNNLSKHAGMTNKPRLVLNFS